MQVVVFYTLRVFGVEAYYANFYASAYPSGCVRGRYGVGKNRIFLRVVGSRWTRADAPQGTSNPPVAGSNPAGCAPGESLFRFEPRSGISGGGAGRDGFAGKESGVANEQQDHHAFTHVGQPLG